MPHKKLINKNSTHKLLKYNNKFRGGSSVKLREFINTIIPDIAKSNPKFIENFLDNLEKYNTGIDLDNIITINQDKIDNLDIEKYKSGIKAKIDALLSKINIPFAGNIINNGMIPSKLPNLIPKEFYKSIGNGLKRITSVNSGNDSEENTKVELRHEPKDELTNEESEDIKKEGIEEDNHTEREDIKKEGIEEGKKAAREELAFSNNNPLNRTFNDVYKIVAWLCVVLFVAIFLLTVLDIFLYSYDYLAQRSSLQIAPNMFNKDTHDYNVLNYIKTNKTSDEPYHVFLCEQLYATVYLLVGITVLMIGIEYGASVLLNFYNAYTGESKDYSVDLSSSKTFLLVILIALVGAAVCTSIYNSYFINKTQTSMFNINQNMKSIKNAMYKNCTTNQVFLNALTSNDLSALVNEFDNTVKNGIKTKDTVEAQRMIFTLSMYSYLSTAIPEIDPNYNTVIGIFNYNNIKNRGIDPTMYLYYNNFNVNIQNLYPKIVQSVSSGLEINGKVIDPTSNADPFFGAENEILQSQFVLGITQQLTTITDIITELSVNGISEGKNNLFMYMILICIAAFIFLIVIFVVIYDEVPQSITERIKYVIGIVEENVNNIKNYIPNLFFGKKNT